MWLTGCLAPDFKTIADFRKDNGQAIRKVCREFTVVCGRAGLLAATTVAINGSKFKAVNSRDRNFTQTKVAKRLEQLEASIERYLAELDTASRLRPKSRSSAASCSISRRKASTASGITAYSPPQAAPPISRGFASCLGQARLPGQVQVLAGTSPRRRSCRPVPVAAGA